MKVKAREGRHLIREAIFDDEPYCELCYRSKSVGIFSTMVGRQYLCLNCVKKYANVMGDNDYFFAKNIEPTPEGDLRINDEDITFVDVQTGKVISNLLERN